MTAVEWLRNELWEQFKFSFSDNIFEQANKMFEEQIKDAQSYAISNADMTNNRGYFDCDKWYAETYGSKGSDKNFKQFSLYEHKETITSADTITSSQTEISDEHKKEVSNELFKDFDEWDKQLKNKQ